MEIEYCLSTKRYIPTHSFFGRVLMNQSLLIASAAIFTTLAAAGVHADALTSVKQKGELTCGVLNGFQPFGYVDAAKSRDVVGYDVDICNALAETLGVKGVVKPLANDAKIPELVQGRVDVLVAALSWTPERAQQIDFSHQYFVARLVVAVKGNSDIKALSDLDGKRISVVKGSTSEVALRNSFPEVVVVSFPDPSSAFLAFRQGKTAAFSISELLMKRFQNDAGIQGNMTVLAETLQTDPWGVGVRKGEEALLQAVNNGLEKLESTGEGKAIFDRWFNEVTGYPVVRDFTFQSIK